MMSDTQGLPQRALPTSSGTVLLAMAWTGGPGACVAPPDSRPIVVSRNQRWP